MSSSGADPGKDGLAEWRDTRSRWVPVDSKLSLEWGTRQAETLWRGLYAKWDPVIDGQTVLDLGCHWGYLLKYVMENHNPKRLIGVDIVPSWEQIPGWDWRAHADVINLHHGDLVDIELEEGGVDLMLSTGTFQSMTPEVLDATLSRAYTLLRPGGEFMLRTHLYTSYLGAGLHRSYDLPYVHMFYGQRALEERLDAAARESPGYFNSMTASSYLAAFTRAGFEIIDASRRMNRHAQSVQQRLAGEFPVSEEELLLASLEARLLRPIEVDELDRFGTALDQTAEHRSGLQGTAGEDSS